MVAITTLILTEKFILNSDFTIILPIMQVKITIENIDWIFLKIADLSYLVKIVLIMHNNCLQADIVHNPVNCSHAEKHSFSAIVVIDNYTGIFIWNWSLLEYYISIDIL